MPGGWVHSRIGPSLSPRLPGPKKQEVLEATMKEICPSIRDYVLREFLPGEDPGELTDRTPLITGGILDSISTLRLVTYLEDHFGIAIEAHEAGVEHLDTIERIGALVALKRPDA